MAAKKSVTKKSVKQRRKPLIKKRKPTPKKRVSKSGGGLLNLLRLIPLKAWSGLGVLAFVISLFSVGSKVLDHGDHAPQAEWQTFNQLRQQAPTFQERMAYWSHWLEGVVTRNEKVPTDFFGPRPQIADSAPLIPEKFDCTTFVETVAALSLSDSPREFYKNLLDIRYQDSDPRYEKRNHFPESDWIANNQKNGLLKDITLEVVQRFGLSENFESKTLYKNRWLSKQKESGKVNRAIASIAESDWNKPIPVRVPYIAMKDIPAIIDRIPQGTIVNLVRKNDDRYDVLISHQGIIVHEDGKTMIRHSSVKGVVQTRPLMSYLNGQAGKAWPIVGINLNQIIN